MLFSGEKIDCGAYAQRDAMGLWVIGNAACEHLLLRHSKCQQNQRRLRLDNEDNTPLNLQLRADNPHGRRVEHHVKGRVSRLQRSAIVRCWTDDCYRKTLLCSTYNEARCQVAASDDWKMQSTEPSQPTKHTTV